MNEFHSYVEEISPGAYRPRWAADILRTLVADFPVTVLTGARQTGKSTLLRREPPFDSWSYVTLDDFDALAAARSDPTALWSGHTNVVIDEVQKAPGLLDAVKLAVDTDSSRRFVLSGSANLLLMSHVGESLAGRAIYLGLGPMTVGEMQSRPAPTFLERMLRGETPDEGLPPEDPSDPLDTVQRGLMPRFLTLPNRSVPAWWDGYVSTYLERDLRALSAVSSLPEFKRLMEAVALRQGQLLNRSELSRDIGLSQATAHRHIGLLQVSEVLKLLPGYAGNRTTRLIKAPKPYFFDSGLAAFLAGHFEPGSLAASREAGASFEAFVLHHVNALCQLISPRPRVHYWRTQHGQEVDIVIEHGRALLGIEIKLSPRVGYSDTAGLRAFRESTLGVGDCMIIHCGPQIREVAKGIHAVPWTALAG